MRPSRRAAPAALLLIASSFLPLALAAQTPPAGVELPLSQYDSLREAARARPAPTPSPPVWGSARLLHAALTLDLEKRRATWLAEIEVLAGGDETPAVALVKGAAVGRSLVTPDSARVEAKNGDTLLVSEEAGAFRVTLTGETGGQGEDELLGVRFPVPHLVTAPAAFDVVVPEGCIASVEGGGALRQDPERHAPRLTLDSRTASVLVLRRFAKAASGPPVLFGTLHVVHRIGDDAVRSEVSLSCRVTRGVLASRTFRFDAASLVAASGPVFATGPSKDGTITLRFEPPVEENGDASVVLTFVTPRKPDESRFTARFPTFPLGPGEHVEKLLTVVTDGGVLARPEGDEDWAPLPDTLVVPGSDDALALSFRSRVETPRALGMTVRRLTAMRVATALARASVTAFVGESGETRLLAAADVRSRGRSTLRFRVPASAVLLGARVGGEPVAASRPSPERVEVPIGGDGGRTVVELLLGDRVPAPKAGEKLTLAAVVPDEPVERLTWSVVLPPGLGVKEEGRAAPPPSDPPSASPQPAPAADPAALELTRRLAEGDRAASREGTWSPRTELPAVTAAYRTDLLDLGTEAQPLILTLVSTKEERSWF